MKYDVIVIGSSIFKDYLGEEVTNDKKYYNSNLSKNSYKT